MPRKLKLAAAQVGAIHKNTPKSDIITRLITLLDQAHSKSIKLVVFPELTFTTFFPRHLLTSSELSLYFEETDPVTSPTTSPLFKKASEYNIDIVVGYAERTTEGKGFNTCIYYSASKGKVLSKYRKVHLPGTIEPFSEPNATNQLEKRYFAPGDLGFTAFRAPDLVPGALKASSTLSNKGQGQGQGEKSEKGEEANSTGKGDPIIGLLICNYRRWPESWRSLALQGAELVLMGYNTGTHMPSLRGTTSSKNLLTPEQSEQEALFHSKLCQTANSYMNACFSVSAARCGDDDGVFGLIAGSMITDPEGHVVAEAKTKEDELVWAEVDLEDCWAGKGKTFDFARHRRVEAYGLIGSQTGVVEPPLLD